MKSKKTVYILLFRGVGGPVQLPVAPLRAALSKAGYENVATYINSGNAVVRTALPRTKVIAEVAAICAKRFGYERPIFAPTLKEWTAVRDGNPFPHAVETPAKLHAVLLANRPEPANIAALRALADSGEELAVIDKVAYVHTPNGFADSKMAMKFDKGIGVVNTARNWNTVRKLVELAEAAAKDSA